MSTLDPRSESNIATLVPKAQVAARKFMEAAVPAMQTHGLTLKIICGTRTYDEQNALYAQGRTRKGPKVTNAPAGYSLHNFGIAWDVCLFNGPVPLWESPYYAECAKIGRSQGLDCGEFWKNFTDEPHYQLATGLSLAQLRDRVAAGKPVC